MWELSPHLAFSIVNPCAVITTTQGFSLYLSAMQSQ
nr:MAG TPA: hypothetical protein [Caudoviricetes sp.]